MADRYWVGGTGTWDASTTTNWSTTSGGAGGASAPTSVDNAYFDGNSDSGAPFTVTIGTGAVCEDVIIGDGSTVTVLDQTMTLAGSSGWSIHGSLYFPPTNFSRGTYDGRITLRATSTGKTITTNGISLYGPPASSSFELNGVGGEWTLGSAFAMVGGADQVFRITNGTLKTANYSLTTGIFVASSGTVVEFGSSLITIGEDGSPFNTSAATVDFGTSTIFFSLSNSNAFFATFGGKTFYDVRFRHNAAGRNMRIVDSNTYNNFTVDVVGSGASTFGFEANQTINGTFSVQSGFGATFDITDTAGAITAATVNAGGANYNVGDVLNVTGGNGDAQLTVATLSGTAIATVTISTPGTGYTTATGVSTTLATSALNPNSRVLVASHTLGTARTITAAAVNITNADFRDITGAGAATWSDSGRTRYWGNCLGNSGITFSAGVSKYRIGTGNWSATQWAATSGGSPAAASFPLAQDTAVFDANTATGTHTLDASYQIGSLSMSALTVAVTLATGSTAPTFYGNVTLDADVTLTGTGTFTFAGQGTTQTITSAGLTFTRPIVVNSPSGTVALADAFTTSSALTLTQGALDLGNQTLTCSSFASNNSNTRSIAFGTGNISVTANAISVVEITTATNFTYTGTPDFNLTYSGSVGSRTVFFGGGGGATEANTININVTAGSDTVLVGNASRLLDVDFSGFSGLWSRATNTLSLYGDLVLSSGMTVGSTPSLLSFIATSGNQQVTTIGKTLDFPITINAPGATVQLVDNLTMGSSRTLTLTAGTLDLNDKALSAQDFSSSNSNTRSIDFGTGGRIELSGSSTVFNATTGTNLTTTGTGVIDLTSASTKTFAGGGANYPTLNQGGLGTLLITGANTFADITNTVQPTTITFPSGVTTSVQDFSVGGTLGNLVTLNASTPGTRAILNRV